MKPCAQTTTETEMNVKKRMQDIRHEDEGVKDSGDRANMPKDTTCAVKTATYKK